MVQGEDTVGDLGILPTTLPPLPGSPGCDAACEALPWASGCLQAQTAQHGAACRGQRFQPLPLPLRLCAASCSPALRDHH